MTIKQEIPENYVESPAKKTTLDALKIDYQEIVTDWRWCNRHAQPVLTTIIAFDDYSRAELAASYYKRISK